MKTWMGLLGVVMIAGAVAAQEEVTEEAEIQFNWIEGPAKGELSSISTLDVPEGYVFLEADEAGEFLEINGNPASGAEIGVLASVNSDWWALFRFDPSGYVKDDEKNDLDASGMLESLREGQEAGNQRRIASGGRALEILGWYKPPYYNDETQNLEWCTKLRAIGEDEPFVNHNIRILGRHGVTEIVLVADINELETAIPELAGILDHYEYRAGNKYGEYRKGDKVAKYGLTALVAGGAAAVALKSGFFKYIWKGLVIGAIAVSGFFKKMFKRDK